MTDSSSVIHDAGTLAAAMRELLLQLRAASADVALDSFLADWPLTPPLRTVLPASLPVLRWLNEQDMAPDTVPLTLALVSKVVRAAARLRWAQSYRSPQVTPAFLENYGWAEVLGPAGAVASTRLRAGLLLLGPHTLYPAHRHPAEELYVMLAGSAAWRLGMGAWNERRAGELVHHRSTEVHAMRTEARPLLALYLWRGALEDPAELMRPQGSGAAP